MKFSPEDLTKIEEMASVYLPISDMAALLDVDADALRMEIRDPETPASKAYRKGKAQTTLELRKQEMALAFAGSPLGIENVTSSLAIMQEQEE